MLENSLHRFFKVLPRFLVLTEQANGKRANLVRHHLPQYAQCSRRLAGHEHAISGSKQVAQQVYNRVALSSSRRSLNEHCRRSVEPLHNLHLLVVGVQWKQDGFRFAATVLTSRT